MYLRGLGGIVVRMPDGNQREFSAISTDLENAILAGGVPLRPNGSPYSVMKFMGGWLFDGCPLNVILGQGWIQGQQEALASAGLVPSCPQLAPIAQQTVAPPVFTQTAAPGFNPQLTTPSGTRILPTGVATATAPQIIMLPGGQTSVLPAEPAQAGEAQEPMLSGGLALGLGLVAALLLLRKKR